MKRGYLWARIEVGGPQPLLVIATHLHHIVADSLERQAQVAVLLRFWDNQGYSLLFGDLNVKPTHRRITLKNPNVGHLTVPMPALQHIVIHIPTHAFHSVERFLTYAINHIGQDYLKKYVEVHIYGDSTQLHTNLRNTLKNLCKQLKEDDS